MPSAGCEIGRTEERIKKEYAAIKLPKTFVEDDRGVIDCCCELLVLAGPSGNSWESDKSSAWVKISDPSDTFQFKLYRESSLASYQPTPNQMAADSSAYYCTIDWAQVISTDGSGCYRLEIEYNISGVTGSVNWAKYNLKAFTINNALGTARIRAHFDGVQEVEGINFTGSDVVSDVRFMGYIGNRQPNMEVDNIIYGNREMKRVIRENLNTYEIITDPLNECIIRPLLDTYLLSENQLHISDYNAHNHSYRYQDIAVIVSESPEVEYYDFSRKAKLTCKVADKYKQSRTYY